jgi:hypothetical protein
VPDIDRDKFATISQMVKLFGKGVSSDTIRRYISKYGAYFNSTFVRGVQYVEKEPALKVLEIIYGAIRAGQNRGGHDVMDALKKAGIEPMPVIPESPVLPAGGVDGLNWKCKEVEIRFCAEDRAIFQDIRDILHKMTGGNK